MTPRELFESLYPRGAPENVYGQDRGCPRRDCAFNLFRVNVEIAGIRVGQNRLESVPQQAMSRGEEREARQNHFARQVQTALNQHETGGATRYRHAIRHTEKARCFLLEAGYPTPVG